MDKFVPLLVFSSGDAKPSELMAALEAASTGKDQLNILDKKITVNKKTMMDEVNSGIGIDQSMQLALCTDLVITKAKIPAVTSPTMFSGNFQPAKDGLFDPLLFGYSTAEKKQKFAYIDLKEKFFHPYIFDVLERMSKAFKQIATGNVCGYINEKTGMLAVAKGPDDPNYNENNTGIPWLIKNFYNIKWNETDSILNKDRRRLLNDLDPKEIFITKYLVVPLFYRDMELSGGRPSVPEINKEYNKVIQYVQSLNEDIFAEYNASLRFKIQSTLNSIRAMGQKLIESKHGFYHRHILGKSIDRGSRDVITTPVMNRIQRPEDNPIDIFHTGVPLAKCLVLGYPFIARYCHAVLEDTFKDTEQMLVYDYSPTKENPLRVRAVRVADVEPPMMRFTQDYIDKRMKRFINTYGSRFEPIRIIEKNGNKLSMHFRGFAEDIEAKDMQEFRRPFTWTDLFYMAAVECLSDKHIYITRFPIVSMNNMYPSLIHPLSTVETIDVTIKGIHYPYYPKIDFSMSPDEVSTKFNDTLNMSNLALSAMNGDYDGDMTSQKMCFCIESNEEAEQIMYSLKHWIDIKGNLLRTLGNEAYLGFYSMTKR